MFSSTFLVIGGIGTLTHAGERDLEAGREIGVRRAVGATHSTTCASSCSKASIQCIAGESRAFHGVPGRISPANLTPFPASVTNVGGGCGRMSQLRSGLFFGFIYPAHTPSRWSPVCRLEAD